MLYMFSIRDVVAEVHNTPFFAVNEAFARRNLVTATRDPNTIFHHHPGDFELHCHGVFDEKNGFMNFSYVEDKDSLVCLLSELEDKPLNLPDAEPADEEAVVRHLQSMPNGEMNVPKEDV